MTPTSENQPKLQQAKEKLSRLYVRVKEEELKELIQKVEESDSTYRHDQSWRSINEITGRKEAKSGVIKGNIKEERIKLWYDHFNNLSGERPDKDIDDILPVFKNLRINDEPFAIPELLKAKKRLCDGKAAGPPVVIKRCYFDEIIMKFANKLIVEGLKPAQWSEIDLVILPKSGDLSDTGNYRRLVSHLLLQTLLTRSY